MSDDCYEYVSEFMKTSEENVKAYNDSIKEALEAIERGEYTELPLLGDSRRNKFESKEEVMKEMSEMVRKAIDQEIVDSLIQGRTNHE